MSEQRNERKSRWAINSANINSERDFVIPTVLCISAMSKFSFGVVSFLGALLAGAAVLIGMIPIGGCVLVGQQNSHRVEAILSDHQISDWTGYGGLGVSQFNFEKHSQLCDVVRDIEDDAIDNGYGVEIYFDRLFPWMSTERTVNPEIGLHGDQSNSLDPC